MKHEAIVITLSQHSAEEPYHGPLSICHPPSIIQLRGFVRFCKRCQVSALDNCGDIFLSPSVLRGHVKLPRSLANQTSKRHREPRDSNPSPSLSRKSPCILGGAASLTIPTTTASHQHNDSSASFNLPTKEQVLSVRSVISKYRRRAR